MDWLSEWRMYRSPMSSVPYSWSSDRTSLMPGRCPGVSFTSGARAEAAPTLSALTSSRESPPLEEKGHPWEVIPLGGIYAFTSRTMNSACCVHGSSVGLVSCRTVFMYFNMDVCGVGITSDQL